MFIFSKQIRKYLISRECEQLTFLQPLRVRALSLIETLLRNHVIYESIL